MPLESTVGHVFFVGAGPGDPGLLTVDGARRLAAADVVLYDYLANDALLSHARPDAVTACLGRHGAGKIWSQEEINRRMVADALSGKTVVRLKGGDPSIFGRLAEETAACRAAGVPFAIVPGVTTAVAAGAFAGVTITDRDRASCVALVTGHPRDNDAAAGAQFERLASFPGTLVVYMGVTTAPEWSRRLIAAGKPSDTPVAIVRRCSLPDQQVFSGVLGDLPTILAPQRVRPPLVVVVGDVAHAAEDAAWFTGRPLFGQTVLVTRPVEQARELAERLAELGARVLHQPAIEIAPPADVGALDRAIDSLGDFDWVVFTSRNGVDAVMTRIEHRGLDARAFGAAKLAVVGPSTAAALRAWRLTADLCPDEYRAEALAAALGETIDGKRVLLVRASRGREVLAESLTVAGARVEQAVAYENRDVATVDPAVVEEIAAGRVDWITVTSPAIARSCVHLFADSIKRADPKPRFAAISPLTAQTLTEAGATPGVVAREYTAGGLIDAVLTAVAGT